MRPSIKLITRNTINIEVALFLTFTGQSGRFHDCRQISAVTAFLQRLCKRDDLVSVDKSLPEGYFLEASNFHPLPGFKRLHKTGGFNEGFDGTSVEPGKTPAHSLNVERAFRKVARLQICDLQLPAR